MISTDFAANESWDDAWESIKLIFQPWKWKRGEETELVKKAILKMLHLDSGRSKTLHLFLTGRSALYYLLKSLYLPKNSEVIVQAFTCEAVVLPILANNFKPVYIDVESETFSMDFNSLTPLRSLSFAGQARKPKVLILQHTFGLTPQHREKILNLAKERRLIVIEDLAHGFNPSIFSTGNPSPVTNHYFLLSFGRSKLLSSVFGGALLRPLNPAGSAGQAIQPRQTWLSQFNNLTMPSYFFIFLCLLYKPIAMLIKSTYDFYFGKVLHKIINRFKLLIPEVTKQEKEGIYNTIFNKAYPNALSMLLLNQLNKFEQIQKQRKIIVKYYLSVILNPATQGEGSRSEITSDRNVRSARFLASLGMTARGLIRYPLFVNNREEILEKARKQNIFLGTWYDQVVGPKDLNLERVEYRKGSCPIAEEISKKIINLPTNINEKEAEKILSILSDVK